MILLGARVDALTCAFRVALDEQFLEQLRHRRTVARRHGRAAFEWRAPADLAALGRAEGDVGAVWRHLSEGIPILGELGPSDAGKYHVKREGLYRLLVLEHGPGGSRFVSDVTGEVIEEPGWTVEIVWYAEALAARGIERCLAEAAAMAWQMGRVLEQAVRRFDLCADVAGWEIHADDAACIVKRPRASYDVATDASEIAELGSRRRRGAPRPYELAGPTTHEAGKPGFRRVCGLSIGAGGALMARIYDKRLELSLAGRERKRTLEHERWREAGWDGEAPVTRIEFQIRGAAIKELGLRDPEAVRETMTDDAGKAIGQRVMRHADGRTVTLSERLPWVWATMLRWVRLVVPDSAQRFASRLQTQWRWRFLELVAFGRVEPIRRCRVRGAASEAQALGVALSQAAKAGELDTVAQGPHAWSEQAHAYARVTAEETLRKRVEWLKRIETARVVSWLLERAQGDPVDACVHLATVARAKWARHALWEAAEASERGPPPPPPPLPPPKRRTSDPFATWQADPDFTT